MWKPRFPNRVAATQRAGSFRRTAFRLLAFAALLAQFQILWLAGFHYHPEVAGAGPSPVSVAAIPGSSGLPAGDSDSCAFCQIVRHGVSTLPSTVALSFHSISTTGLAPIAVVRPIAHPQIRLAGRDPPNSSLASR